MIKNLFLSLFTITLLTYYSVVHAELFEIIKPAKLSFQQKSDEKTYEYEIRKGYIEFETGIVYPELKIKVNDLLRVTLFENLQYECIVEKINKNENGTISIAGKIMGYDFSTFLITLDKDNFLLNLKDLKKNYVYNANGSVINKLGIITEIDVAKLPPIIHSPPLIPLR